jgi:uncharacterized protein
VVRNFIDRSLRDMVPRDHRQSERDLRRRQWVTVAFTLLGAVVLGILLRLQEGSWQFVAMSLVLAAVWTVGAFASGPIHLGRIARGDIEARPIIQPFVLGAALVGLFVAGALVVREIPWLADQVRGVLGFATEGTLWVLVIVTAVNGIAEELFFRGAAYAAITRRPVVWTTVLYTIATAATGNIMLSFAAVLLGVIVGLQRRASGGILAPIITHCTWSLSMLFLLPAIFGV